MVRNADADARGHAGKHDAGAEGRVRSGYNGGALHGKGDKAARRWTARLAAACPG
jgi:hypothetical protein